MTDKATSLVGSRTNVSPLDQYSTPEYATEALFKRERFNGLVWECASGTGRMSNVIKRYNECVESDILKGVDFLKTHRIIQNIVTNPPFNLAQAFVEHALECATEKVAMFLRLNYLESSRRYTFFKSSPLRVVYVFSKRQTLKPDGVVLVNGGTLAYAWYVWDKSYRGSPTIDWIND